MARCRKAAPSPRRSEQRWRRWCRTSRIRDTLQSSRLPKADDVLEMPVAQNPFQIFDGCCAKVGLLGDAVGPVVEAYGPAKSIEADLRFLPDRHRRQALSREQLLSVHQNIKTKSAAMVSVGELAMTRLRQQENRQFWLWQRKK